jgi:invasion protein IalB
MQTTRKHIAPLLAAVAIVAAISTAPVAAADEQETPPPPSQSCSQLGAAEYKCESPGNAQLNDAPPVTNFFPQGDD